MKVELNIGLNNNPYDFETASAMITGADSLFSMEQYNGNPEPTAVIRFYTSMTRHDIEMYVSMLCDMMTQECIAVLMDDSDGMMVFNPSYQGERYEFSMDYFRRYEDVSNVKFDALYDYVDMQAVEGDDIAISIIEEYGYDATYDLLYDYVDKRMIEGCEIAESIIKRLTDEG